MGIIIETPHGSIVTPGDYKLDQVDGIVSKEEVQGKIAFQTKGDANQSADSEKFTKDGIIGKEIFKLPYIGYPVGYAKTTPGLILLIIVPAVIIIYDEMNKIKEEIKKKFQYIIIIPFIYEYAHNFSEGLARVEKHG